MKNPLFLTLVLTLAISSPLFSAEILAKWDLSGEDGAQEEVLSTKESLASGLQASPLTRGTGLFPTKSSSFTEDGFAASSTPQTQTIEDAVRNQTFFEVTLTPEKGKSLDLDSVCFASKRASKNSGPNLLIVRTSLDGFSDDVSLPTEVQKIDGPDACDIDLLFDGGLRNVTEAITLRFYGFNRKQPDNPDGGVWVINNHSEIEGFAIKGTVSPK